jgi:pimeloyl-ACP methyl ester carboxylesterase
MSLLSTSSRVSQTHSLSALRTRFESRRRARARTPVVAARSAAQRGFISYFIAAADGLMLHVRLYGSRAQSSAPVICLPGLARTAADFHSLATALAMDLEDPRWVLALDYRGHGQSGYDRNPDNYALGTDLADLDTVLNSVGVPPAVFIASSYGGALALRLARSRPAAIAGLILNDIGPVIEPRALLQMKGHVGKLPAPRDFAEGGEILRRLFGARFPKLGCQEWIAFAERTWRERGDRLVPDYDARLSRMLQVNLEQSSPTLWNEFDALADIPLMVIRGANSTMLSAETMDAMLARRRELEVCVVPDQGHAPLLESPELLRRIATFVWSCRAAVSARHPPSRSPIAHPV